MSQQSRRPSMDVHTHIGLSLGAFLSGRWPYSQTAQDLLERMDRYNIEKAACFPFVIPSAFDLYAYGRERTLTLRDGHFPYDYENPQLLNEIDWLGARDRLLPLAMFDPARRVEPQVQALERLADQIVGLKTQTEILRSPIRNLLGEAKGILELAQAHGLPVLFHTAVAPKDECSQVRDCLDVAEAWPSVRFNLAHSLRFDRAGLERAAALPNVWVDCSAHRIHCKLAVRDLPLVAPTARRVEADYTNPTAVLEAVHAILGDSYLWGSDSPAMSWCDKDLQLLCTYGEEIETLNALPAHIRRSMLRDAPHAWLYGE